MRTDPVRIEALAPTFHAWGTLLALLHEAFEYQRERIDPPSSLYALDEARLAVKAAEERVFVRSRTPRLNNWFRWPTSRSCIMCWRI